MCLNTNPYTYLGNRPFNVAPRGHAGPGPGDVHAAFRSRDLVRSSELAASALGRAANVRRRRRVDLRTDVDKLTVNGYGPFPYQVDGDYLGETSN